MIVPGANLLGMALGVIQPQTVKHLRWMGSTIGANGQDVNTYAGPVDIQGSMQSTDSTLLANLGLAESQANYKTLYTSANVATVWRDKNGDLIEFDGKRYQCLTSLDWRAQDGWQGVLAVQVPEIEKPVPAPAGGPLYG